MIFSSLYVIALVGFALKINAQCVTAGYVPCLVPGANIAVPPPPLTPFGGSGFFSSVSSAAGDPIQVGRRNLDEDSELADGYLSIEKRQNSLCCRPAPVQCLYTDGIPFCYNPATTRLYFSDGSIAFLSNDTFYGADGTFIDYATGVYIYPNGTEVDFTPDGSAASSSTLANTPSTSTIANSVSPSSSAASAKGTPLATATHSSSLPSTSVPSTASTSTSSSSQSSSSPKSNDATAPVQPSFLFAVLGVLATLY